jgi:chromate transporter
MSKAQNLAEIAGSFLKLGLISFGGPIAHLGYFREEFVRRRRWVDDATYTDLVALCQFLPGPTSSQVAFALGQQRAGFGGGLLAGLCFLLPSAVLMIVFAYGLTALGPLSQIRWIHGLKLAAVGVVAQAVWGMGATLCPDWPRRALALAAIIVLFCPLGPAGPMAAIAFGAVAGGWGLRPKPGPAATPKIPSGRRRGAIAALGAFGALLVLFPVVADSLGKKNLEVLASFSRAGSLVFGGGHVVLPLLRAELVPRHWISDEAFLAGYGAAQAVPGPLFSFAAYLGAVILPGRHPWHGAIACLFAIFLPGWLLISGILPFWQTLRRHSRIQGALRGASAAVVGVLLAALYDPIWIQGVHNWADAAAAVTAFALLTWGRTPAWLIVLTAAAAGQWLL